MLNKKLFQKGEVVAVALSGGKDSVCLIDMLLQQRGELGITVKAVNVEHGIRGESSENDSLFVKELCKKREVDLYFKKVDCPSYAKRNGLSMEESARILRYGVFDEAISIGFCNKIATAHHANDQAETILFNLFRGASPLGASGMDSSVRVGKIIRPILTLSRAEIDDYAAKNGLDYVVDETNADTRYTRNFLRLNVIPTIEERFPEAVKSMVRFADIVRDDDKYLTECAINAIREENREIYFSADLPKPVFSRAALIAMKRLGIKKDYESLHLEATYNLKNLENGKAIKLPKGVIAVKDYGRITFYKRDGETFNSRDFSLGKHEAFGKKYTFEISTDTSLKNDNNRLIADFAKIPEGCVLRTRIQGDMFTKFGGGTKKLKDYFIDKKIPQRERDKILLLAKDEKILIICGIEISDVVKVDKSTESVLQCIKDDK